MGGEERRSCGSENEARMCMLNLLEKVQIYQNRRRRHSSSRQTAVAAAARRHENGNFSERRGVKATEIKL